MTKFSALTRGTFAALLLATAGTTLPNTAHALTAKECHAKFKAAKDAKTLNGQSYKEFKAAQCTDTAPANQTADADSSKTAKPATTSAPAATTTPTPSTPAAPGTGMTSKPTAVAAGNVVFPNAIAPQYAKLAAGRARLKTCADQWHANKQSGGNGNMKWVQKGGGYWPACNAHLKG